jgi:hypothetical protein
MGRGATHRLNGNALYDSMGERGDERSWGRVDCEHGVNFRALAWSYVSRRISRLRCGQGRLTTGLAALAERDRIRVNCVAPGWIATGGAFQYWSSLTPTERVARGVPARLIEPDQVANLVIRLATDVNLAGRVVIWWSEKRPRLLVWGDRGYAEYSDY